MIQVADSLIMSVLRFGLEFCGRDHANLVRLQRTLNAVLRVITRSGRRTSVRWMLSHTGIMNMKLQMMYQRMSLVRRALMTGACPLTVTMVRYPGPRSRNGHYRCLMPNRSSKYGDSSIITVSLELLNSIGYHKKVTEAGGIHPGKQWFKSSSTNHLKQTVDNGNLH